LLHLSSYAVKPPNVVFSISAIILCLIRGYYQFFLSKKEMSPFYTKGDSNLPPKYTPDTSSYPKQA